jgi:hypothetical protein
MWERESVCVCDKERERETESVCVCVCVCERGRVCTYVWERSGLERSLSNFPEAYLSNLLEAMSNQPLQLQNNSHHPLPNSLSIKLWTYTHTHTHTLAHTVATLSLDMPKHLMHALKRLMDRKRRIWRGSLLLYILSFFFYFHASRNICQKLPSVTLYL